MIMFLFKLEEHAFVKILFFSTVSVLSYFCGVIGGELAVINTKYKNTFSAR